jgi:hypothetical protein
MLTLKIRRINRMADVISFTIKTDIATQNPEPDLNQLIIDISDTIEKWAKTNKSKDVYFDSNLKFYHLSDKRYEKMETHCEAEKRIKAEIAETVAS